MFESLLDIIASNKGSGYEALFALLLSILTSLLPLVLRATRVIRDQKKDDNKKINFKSIKKNIISFIDKYFPTWQSLKGVSNNRIFRTSFLWVILVPFTAKILSKTEKGANFTLESFPDLNITLGVPFSWNLFYFASLSFVLAGIIYSWKAPNLIKKYNDFKDFIAKDNSGVTIINEVEKNLETNDERIYYFNHVSSHINRHSEGGEAFRRRLMINSSDTETQMANLFALSVQYLDRKFLFPRVLTTLFYFLSFSFYGYVILQQSIFVIKEFIAHSV